MRALHWSLVSTLFCFILLLPDAAGAKNTPIATQNYPKYILFVNQVRGEECCDPGNIDSLNQQLEVFAAHKLSATFALRYDALNQKFVNPIVDSKQNHEVAAFLEITPSLAMDAGVAYYGNADSWYRAKHSYLVGYTPEDRIKLIDAYMSRFKSLLDSYPKTTVAWMIDPVSLAYLSETYGVTAHEITREQWGTDSYTLHGGPPHYPYFPSPNWTLVPSDQANSMPLIFRQTVSDPLKNYGDFTSAFTSQPNDYLSGKNDFNYFKSLMKQTLQQPGNEFAFAVLGLENSMHAEFQDEYFKQINYIKELSMIDERIKIVTANNLRDLVLENSPSILSGGDLTNNSNEKAWWITTSTYRLRLRYDGNNLFINDARLYSDSIPDPYLTEALSLPNGYWITPFILDSSRVNKEFATMNQKPFSLLESILAISPFSTPKDSGHFFEPGASPDLGKTSPAIYLPKPDATSLFSIERANSEISFKYSSKKNTQTLIFQNDSFQLPQNTHISSLTSTSLINLDQSSDIVSIPSIKLHESSLSWINGEDSAFGLNVDNNSERYVFTPFFKENIDWVLMRQKFAYTFNPEAHANTLSKENTIFYAHNPQAIAGNNPVRFILQGYDSDNLPIAIKDVSVDTQNDSEVSVQTHKPTQFNGGWWIDISSQSSGTKDVQINFDNISRTTKAYFIENCRTHAINCVKNPLQGAQFLKVKLLAKIESLSHKW